MGLISIVSPVYEAEQIIPRLVQEITEEIERISDAYEIILVDDRSTDRSWEVIKMVCSNRSNIIGLRLSRNFGQHSAITAGLEVAKGDWIVVMDCDLQDRPDQISYLYNKAKEGFDIVVARRYVRNDSRFKQLSSHIFYSVFSYLTSTKQDSSIANFGIYSKKVIKAVLSMQDNIRYFPAMIQWVGYRSTFVNVKHSSRAYGRSTYNLRSLFRLAMNNIISFSDKPLRLAAQFGFMISSVSLVIGAICFVGYFLGLIKIAGYTSLIISIWLTFGINIFVLGLVGIYVGKAFEKIKGRPVFLIDELINNV